HLDPEHARGVVLEMRRLAELGPRDRLDVQRPPPAGLGVHPPGGPPADVDEVDPALLENPFLVGLPECLVLRLDCGWHRMPPVIARGAVGAPGAACCAAAIAGSMQRGIAPAFTEFVAVLSRVRCRTRCPRGPVAAPTPQAPFRADRRRWLPRVCGAARSHMPDPP